MPDQFLEKDILDFNIEDPTKISKASELGFGKPPVIVDETETTVEETLRQGPFEISDHFVMLLLHVRSNTKVTTLNRINSYKTLIFMGNGNGIISHAKGRGLTPALSL